MMASRAASGRPAQVDISSMVRPQPRQSPVVGSITHTLIHGDEGLDMGFTVAVKKQAN
jgi:hypothetical protein